MEPDKAVSALAHFFNDFIGSVVPGLVLLLLFALLHPSLWQHMPENVDLENGATVLAIIGVCFAAGYCLLGLYFGVVQPLLSNRLVRTEYAIFEEVKGHFVFQALAELVKGKLGLGSTSASLSPHEVRNIAMTLSEKSAVLGRRFMFIALLGCGTGTAFVVMAFLTVFEEISYHYFDANSFLVQYEVWWGLSVQFVLLLLVALVFFRRGDEFLYRALVAPLSVALAEITTKQTSDANKE